ncbi:MAG: glycosyltransferase [Anaerolineales bacterium]|jgi:glycosyltransferase involved in cell wall biosynthesis
MRILIAETPQYIAFNGQAIFTINLAEGLARNGHTVLALVGSERGHAYQSERNGVLIHAVDSLDLSYIHPDSRLPLFSARAVRQVFKTFQPDIVHIQDHYFLCRNAAITAQHLGVKCVGTNHFMPENLAPYIPVLSGIKPVFNWVLWHWMRETYDRLDAVASPSGTAARMLRSAGVRPPVFPISCGGNTRFFHPDPAVDRLAWRSKYGIDLHKTIFFFVGRVDREKRLDVLLRAVSLLKREDLQLVIGGKGAYLKKLTSLAKKLGLGAKVHFTGFIPQEDLPSVLKSIDIFAMPSEAELLSIATLQAMGCARPVLAANAVALPELVNEGINGSLFQPGNAADAARCMDWFADHPDLWSGMGSASLAKVQPHSLENIVHEYETLYEKVLSGNRLDFSS